MAKINLNILIMDKLNQAKLFMAKIYQNILILALKNRLKEIWLN